MRYTLEPFFILEYNTFILEYECTNVFFAKNLWCRAQTIRVPTEIPLCISCRMTNPPGIRDGDDARGATWETL
jgi:hypothetical protein